MDQDLDLVGRARNGDLDAFGELVRRHQHRLVNYVRVVLSHPADAEDVAQETFLRAYRGLAEFRGHSSFKTWLYQIATNAARTQFERRRGRREDQPDEARGFSGLESGENVERRVIAHDRVTRALAELPEDWREAVVLRDIEGFEYREIAEALNIPIGTVESRIFRGRQRLKQALTTPVAEKTGTRRAAADAAQRKS